MIQPTIFAQTLIEFPTVTFQTFSICVYHYIHCFFLEEVSLWVCSGRSVSSSERLRGSFLGRFRSARMLDCLEGGLWVGGMIWQRCCAMGGRWRFRRQQKLRGWQWTQQVLLGRDGLRSAGFGAGSWVISVYLLIMGWFLSEHEVVAPGPAAQDSRRQVMGL